MNLLQNSRNLIGCPLDNAKSITLVFQESIATIKI